MSDKTTTSLQGKVENFLRANWLVLTIVTVLIVAGIVVLTITITIGRTQAEKEAEALYAIEQAFTEWQSNFDEENPQAEDILTLLNENSFKEGGYPYYRQYFLTGLVQEAMDDFSSAASAFSAAVEADGYLGASALLKAGLALEATGDLNAARDMLVTLVDDYDTAEEPRVLFTLGRLSELLEDYETAGVYYNRLIDEYTSSGWTNFAHNRIIDLKVKNKLGD